MSLICPFCNEEDFDDIGLCYHLASDCKSYDNACRRASDEQERRWSRKTNPPAAGEGAE